MNKEPLEIVRGSGNVFRDFDLPNPDLEQLEALTRERPQGRLLHLQEVRQHLAPGAAVDALLGDPTVPAPQVLVHRLQALEVVALQRVVVDVAAAAFLNALLLRMSRSRRQRCEAQCLAKAS